MTSKLKLGSKIPLTEIDDISQKADIDFLNVSSDAKKNANIWDAPDYTKGINLNVDMTQGTKTGTFTQDGWFSFRVGATGNSSARISVFVNDNWVLNLALNSIQLYGNTFIKVKKGDVWKVMMPIVTAGACESKLFPFRY